MLSVIQRYADEDKAAVEKKAEEVKHCTKSLLSHRVIFCHPPAQYPSLTTACTSCNHRTLSIYAHISKPWRFLPSLSSEYDNDVIENSSIFDQVRHARGAVMAANEAAIEMRRAARQRENEEVESILAYQAMKVCIQV